MKKLSTTIAALLLCSIQGYCGVNGPLKPIRTTSADLVSFNSGTLEYVADGRGRTAKITDSGLKNILNSCGLDRQLPLKTSIYLDLQGNFMGFDITGQECRKYLNPSHVHGGKVNMAILYDFSGGSMVFEKGGAATLHYAVSDAYGNGVIQYSIDGAFSNPDECNASEELAGYAMSLLEANRNQPVKNVSVIVFPNEKVCMGIIKGSGLSWSDLH